MDRIHLVVDDVNSEIGLLIAEGSGSAMRS